MADERAAAAVGDWGRPAFSPLRTHWLLLSRESRLGGAVICCLLAAMFGVFPGLRLAHVAVYFVEGEWAIGTVVRKSPVACDAPPCDAQLACVLAHGGGGRGPTRRIAYTFVDHTQTPRNGETIVEFAAWQRHRIGDRVDVVYARSTPDRNMLWAGMQDGDQAAIGFAVASMFFVALASALAVSGAANVRREATLLRDGALARGTIVAARVEANGRKGATAQLRYTFRAPSTPAGMPEGREGACTLRNGWKITCTVGASVPVVYDPHDPERSTVDRFSLRAAEFDRLVERSR